MFNRRSQFTWLGAPVAQESSVRASKLLLSVIVVVVIRLVAVVIGTAPLAAGAT